MKKNSFKIFKILISVFFLWFLFHSIYLIIDGISDEGKKADLAVILGSKVNEDGTLSERLEKRLESGIELYKSRRIKKILVSGGLERKAFMKVPR